MCGIVGTFAFEGSSFRMTDSLLTRMRDTMIHRGPDGGGVGSEFLAHLRGEERHGPSKNQISAW